MQLGLEDGQDQVLRVAGKLWEHEFAEDAGVVDEILGKLFHLLFEGLLIGLALEFIGLLEDGSELDVFYVGKGDLEVAADEDQLELFVAIGKLFLIDFHAEDFVDCEVEFLF